MGEYVAAPITPLPTPSPQSPPARAWVLLRHTLPDGSWHYDWMLETLAGGPLVTFRVQHRPDAPETRWFEAERIADHRREYLMYEGPVSGNRGEVRRVGAGVVIYWSETPERCACSILSVGVIHAWTGEEAAVANHSWIFERSHA